MTDKVPITEFIKELKSGCYYGGAIDKKYVDQFLNNIDNSPRPFILYDQFVGLDLDWGLVKKFNLEYLYWMTRQSAYSTSIDLITGDDDEHDILDVNSDIQKRIWKVADEITKRIPLPNASGNLTGKEIYSWFDPKFLEFLRNLEIKICIEGDEIPDDDKTIWIQSCHDS